jgi:hypothetical protein
MQAAETSAFRKR